MTVASLVQSRTRKGEFGLARGPGADVLDGRHTKGTFDRVVKGDGRISQ